MQAERTAEQVAWAAGLFEGEGWWGVRGKTSAEAVLGSTDLDVVTRFAEIVGFGSINTEERAAGHKTLYRWSATSATRVGALIELFWPWMGTRRRAKALTILEAIKDCPGPSRARTQCRKGHQYNDADTYTVPGSGYRQCRICSRERDRKYRANRSR